METEPNSLLNNALTVGKRWAIGALAIFSLFILMAILALISHTAALIGGIVTGLVGLAGLKQPIPELRVRNRVAAWSLLIFVAPFGLIYGLFPPEQNSDQSPNTAAVEEEGSAGEPVEATAPGEAPKPPPPEQTEPEKIETVDADVALRVGRPSAEVDERFGDWRTVCRRRCRTYTVAELQAFSNSDPLLVVLEIDGDGQIIVSGLNSEARHRKFYTNRAAVELRRNGVNYVRARGFFAPAIVGGLRNGQTIPDRPNRLTIIGGSTIDLSLADEAHLTVPLTSDILTGFRDGTTAKLEFRSLVFSQFARPIQFSLIGFTNALAARTDIDQQDNSAEDAQSPEPVTLVEVLIRGNRFGLDAGDLEILKNPNGEGHFVFVPERRVQGFKRSFAWFVRGSEVVALNGTAKDASPRTAFPLDMPFRFWRGTGLSAQTATPVGLKLIGG